MVERPARLFKLIRKDERVLVTIVSYPNVVLHIVGGIIVDHLGEVLNERDLTGGIHPSKVERPVLGLLLVCECSDDRVSREQRDQTEQEEQQASDVREATNSEDRAGL